jgi:hypothetical protein
MKIAGIAEIAGVWFVRSRRFSRDYGDFGDD